MAGRLHAMAQIVDDMLALLSASVLQLLGGACSSRAAADEALKVSFQLMARTRRRDIFLFGPLAAQMFILCPLSLLSCRRWCPLERWMQYA